MKWNRYSLKQLWPLWAGLLVFFSAAFSSVGETFTDYYSRLEDMWDDATPRWLWLDTPGPESYWNFTYRVNAVSADDNGRYFTSEDNTGSFSAKTFRYSEAPFLRNYPSEGHYFNFKSDGSSDVLNMYGWAVRCLDPAYPSGSFYPYGLRSGYDHSSWNFLHTNYYSRNVFISHAYVLPQRIFETNNWGNLLWRMYGDDRAFLPRIVYQGGWLSTGNVSPFDVDLWEQMWFFSSPAQTSARAIRANYPSEMNDPDTATIITADGGDYFIDPTIQNKHYWMVTADDVDPENFPLISELFKESPRMTSAYSWAKTRYIAESVTFGDFGVNATHSASVQEKIEAGKKGCRGIAFAPVSRNSGATLSFRRFYFFPYCGASTNNVGLIAYWVPSGIAWDSRGGLLFNWSAKGIPFSSLFSWPYTSSWDFDYSVMLLKTGQTIGPYPPENFIDTTINSHLPAFGPQLSDGGPTPPVRPAGGGGAGGGGANPFFPIPSLGGGSIPVGNIGLGGSSGSGGGGSSISPGSIVSPGVGGGGGTSVYIEQNSPELVSGGVTVTYVNETQTAPQDDSGDAVGNYIMDFPGLENVVDMDYFLDKNYWARESESAIESQVFFERGEYGGGVVTDFEDTMTPSGDFGLAVGSVTGEGNPQNLFGHWDNSQSWFFSTLPLEPVIPKSSVVVLPWFMDEDGNLDFTATKEFSLVGFDSSRDLCLLFVGVGMSCIFILSIMRIFQGGN